MTTLIEYIKAQLEKKLTSIKHTFFQVIEAERRSSANSVIKDYFVVGTTNGVLFFKITVTYSWLTAEISISKVIDGVLTPKKSISFDMEHLPMMFEFFDSELT